MPRFPRSQAARDREAWADEIRKRREFLEQVYEYLPVGFTAKGTRLVSGPQGSLLLVSARGQNLAQFFDHNLGRFLLDSVDNLTAFSEYIAEIERDAYERRREFRRLDRVRNELLGADGLGVGTKDGQRRVRAAIAALHDRDLDDD